MDFGVIKVFKFDLISLADKNSEKLVEILDILINTHVGKSEACFPKSVEKLFHLIKESKTIENESVKSSNIQFNLNLKYAIEITIKSINLAYHMNYLFFKSRKDQINDPLTVAVEDFYNIIKSLINEESIK